MKKPRCVLVETRTRQGFYLRKGRATKTNSLHAIAAIQFTYELGRRCEADAG